VIGHTDRFRAACPENPVFNWFSMYGTSDLGADFSVRELGGTPSDAEDVYRRCSPITYAHRCTTPTLFLQHENDYRCPAEQTEQFYTVLRVNGVPAEMLRFPNTPHGGSILGPITHRRAQNDALLGWMNRYVLGVSARASGQELTASPSRARGKSGGLRDPLGERGILGAQPVDLRPLDCDDDAVAQCADARRAQPVGREERPLSDHGAGAELTGAFWRLHEQVSLRDHVQARSRLPALDQDLPGRELHPGADRLERDQIVLVHAAEYRIAGKLSARSSGSGRVTRNAAGRRYAPEMAVEIHYCPV
jgi:hypothetical protein